MTLQTSTSAGVTCVAPRRAGGTRRIDASDGVRLTNSLTLAALLGATCLSLACGDGVRISLQLSTAQNGNPAADASSLQSLTVLIDNGEVNDRESFELNRDEQVLVPQMSVDKTKPFLMEAWGCAPADRCELEDVVLRGCTVQKIDVRNQVNETIIVQMTMYNAIDNTLRLCPSIGGDSAVVAD